MKIKKSNIAYITPEKGEGMLNVAKAIAKEIKEGELKDTEKIFFNFPDGKQIQISGETPEEIRDSMATQWSGDPTF